VLKGFAAAKCIDKVFAVYDEMQKQGVQCNSITYNTMFDACAKCCAMDRASSLLKDMHAASVKPDIITYSTIVKGHCFEGDIDKALAVFQEMKKTSMVPDEIMYNSFLDGCAKQHRTEEALSILEEMQAAGVCPSNYTLSILVKLLGRARCLNQAFSVVEGLSRRHGFKPNVQVYTCLMQACILNRKLDRALTLHDTMVKDGCSPDQKLYTGLVRGCLQLHAPQKAADVVRAAYLLPGSGLASPKSSSKPAGVEMNVIVELCTRLRGSSRENQAEADALAADLVKFRGIRIGNSAGNSSPGPCHGSAAGVFRRNQQ
jgi:pentatricopeptide repeat protein